MAASLNGEGTQLLDALEAVVRKIAPDKENIRGLVEEVVEERLPRVIEVHSGDSPLGSIEEHVRPEFDKIAMAVYSGVNVFLSGPAGCGKTHLASQIAKALGLRFGFIPLTAGITESRLVGRFVPIGENGSFKHIPAQFADFYKNGGLFLLDEVDAADANVMLTINAALANGHMETPNPEEPIITRHPQFRCIAAANTWGSGANRQYVGRNQLDAATLDRFIAKFSIGYDEHFERRAGNADLVAWAHDLRRKVEEHGIRRVVSTRLVLDGTRMMSAGFSLGDVQTCFFEGWTENEKSLVN